MSTEAKETKGVDVASTGSGDTDALSNGSASSGGSGDEFSMAEVRNNVIEMLGTFDPKLILELVKAQAATISELEELSEEQKDKMEAQAAKISELEERNEKHVLKCNEYKSDNTMLSNKVKRMKVAKELDEKCNCELEQSVRSLTDDNSALKKEKVSLQNKIVSLEKKCDFVEGENQELKEWKARVKACTQTPRKLTEASQADPDINAYLQDVNSNH